MAHGSLAAAGTVSRPSRSPAPGRFPVRASVPAGAFGPRCRGRHPGAPASPSIPSAAFNRAAGHLYSARAEFLEFTGRPRASADGSGAGGKTRPAPLGGHPRCTVSGFDLRRVHEPVPVARRTDDAGEDRCDRVSRGVLSFLRSLLLPV